MSSDIQRRDGSSSSDDSGRQRRTRPPGPRKVNYLLNIDVAEARRQVYHALLLHRKSSSFPSCSSSSSSSPSHDVINGASSTQLLQSMPPPEPVWSTTAPTVLPHISHMPYSGGAAMEAAAIEFEWGENQASAYAWWLAFLKSLDSTSKTAVPQEFKYPLALGSSNWFFGQMPGYNFKVEEADDHEQIPSPDEWLIIPTTEYDEGEFNHVIP